MYLSELFEFEWLNCRGCDEKTRTVYWW